MHLKKYQIIVLTVFLGILVSLVVTVFAALMVTEAASSPDFPYQISVKGAEITPTPFQPNAFAYQVEAGLIEFVEQQEEEKGIVEQLPQPVNTPTPVPTVPPLDMPDDQWNILLLGSDSRNDGGYRTDVIMLVSINPEYDDVSIVSFPRDLYVTIPGWQMNRINTAHQVGGFSLLADTLEFNFGIRPDNYVMVDFEGFREVIDTLGGIDVYVEEYFEDACDHTLSINSWCFVGPGWEHMDSDWALWYSRARYSTSDFDRGRRTQEVVKAIFQKAMSLNVITKIPELYQLYTQYVETDIRVGDILPYVGMANKVRQDMSMIRRYAIGENECYDWWTAEGAWVQIPDYYAIYPILVEALHLD